LDPQHERPDLGLVVVQPPPLQADDVLLGDLLVAGGDQRRQLVADAERGLLLLDALDRVALEDELPVGGGTFASGSHGGHSVAPGVRLDAARPAATPARVCGDGPACWRVASGSG